MRNSIDEYPGLTRTEANDFVVQIRRKVDTSAVQSTGDQYTVPCKVRAGAKEPRTNGS